MSVFLKTLEEFTFGGFDIETYCSFPGLRWFTVVFGLHLHRDAFFSTVFIILVPRECSILSPPPKQAGMLAPFNMTGFQHFDKDATVTRAVLGASIVSL